MNLGFRPVESALWRLAHREPRYIVQRRNSSVTLRVGQVEKMSDRGKDNVMIPVECIRDLDHLGVGFQAFFGSRKSGGDFSSRIGFLRNHCYSSIRQSRKRFTLFWKSKQVSEIRTLSETTHVTDLQGLT